MNGTINVRAYMEGQERARNDEEKFIERLWHIRISNALWAYRGAKDKQAVVKFYRAEFDRMNRGKLGY